MEINVTHDQESQEFSVPLENGQAELTYAKPEDAVMDFQHTFVPEKFRKQGIATKLIETGLKYAESQKFKIIASCPAVSAFIRRHKQYEKLLKSSS